MAKIPLLSPMPYYATSFRFSPSMMLYIGASVPPIWLLKTRSANCGIPFETNTGAQAMLCTYSRTIRHPLSLPGSDSLIVPSDGAVDTAERTHLS